MANKSNIEWTDATWNPVTGCTRVSKGCDHCYAATMSRRLEGMGVEAYRGVNGKGHFNGVVRCHEDKLDIPFGCWRTPRRVFVCSMSDLFHEGVPNDFIVGVWATMAASKHTYQVLTKRPKRASELLSGDDFQGALRECIRERFEYDDGDRGWVWQREWPLSNVELGTSIEDQETANLRIPHLLKCPAAVRFVSYEPALGAVEMSRALGWPGTPAFISGGIDWVIVGGESGPGARPMHPDWARDIRDQCKSAAVPFFFKQWGEWAPVSDVRASPRIDGDLMFWSNGHTCPRLCLDGMKRPTSRCHSDSLIWIRRIGKKRAGRLLDGRVHDGMPAARPAATPAEVVA